MIGRITGEPPAMWGPSIVGFGSHDWVGANGKATPWPVAGFSPRKAALVVYLMPGFPGRDAMLAKLGKHTIGKSCLYIKRLSDVDRPTRGAGEGLGRRGADYSATYRHGAEGLARRQIVKKWNSSRRLAGRRRLV